MVWRRWERRRVILILKWKYCSESWEKMLEIVWRMCRVVVGAGSQVTAAVILVTVRKGGGSTIAALQLNSHPSWLWIRPSIEEICVSFRRAIGPEGWYRAVSLRLIS